jgi:hypothetical protein
VTLPKTAEAQKAEQKITVRSEPSLDRGCFGHLARLALHSINPPRPSGFLRFFPLFVFRQAVPLSRDAQ